MHQLVDSQSENEAGHTMGGKEGLELPCHSHIHVRIQQMLSSLLLSICLEQQNKGQLQLQAEGRWSASTTPCPSLKTAHCMEIKSNVFGTAARYGAQFHIHTAMTNQICCCMCHAALLSGELLRQ